MRMTTTSHRVTVIAAIAACWLGGCANSMTDVLSTARLPTFDMQLRPLSQEAPPPPTLTRIQITQADLVAADGACAPATAESATGQTTGVALGMPECGLVQVLGQPEQLNISADESGRRIVVMRYNKGERAGLYQFSDGQLKVIERVAEPAPPPKPKKPAPAPKPRRVT